MRFTYMNPSVKINHFFEYGKWAEARRFIEGKLEELPANDWMRHWWLTRLSTAYYEERKYKDALEFAKQAQAIAPDCPLVLWDLAGALDMVGRDAEAIELYKKLIRKRTDSIASDQCGEGQDWAKGLLADCLYRLAECYADLGDDSKSLHFLNRFKLKLEDGVSGIYTKDDADRIINRNMSVIETRINKQILDTPISPISKDTNSSIKVDRNKFDDSPQQRTTSIKPSPLPDPLIPCEYQFAAER
jgi:tetratricopeptide (TPR) repeat protein